MQKNKGVKRLALAGVYALNGIRAAFRHEAAFRQEVVIACLLLPLTIVLPVTTLERVMLVGVTLLVMIVELLNSAVEAVVDRVSVERHELSGRAKDMGSAAVLISLVLWLYTWIEILLIGA